MGFEESDLQPETESKPWILSAYTKLVSLGAFAASELDVVFSGYQPR
jgi:hypothetical protein